jgi:Protein of unknown function (DUF3631)
LTDVRSAFNGAEHMFTAELLAALHLMDEAPWGDLRGKPIDSRWLAKVLKPYGAQSQSVRIGEKTAKGYNAEDLYEAWSRYVPGEGSQASHG